MSELDQILTPIAGDNPSGADLEYDSRFQEIETLIESGDAENPTNWKTVKKQSLELLKESRSIEFLVILAVAMVDVDGYQGLRDGLHLITKSVEDFWENIYPQLDMEEPEPDRYEMRLNMIAQLGEKPGKMGDKLSYVEKILRAPLSASNQRVSATFWPVWESESTERADDSEANSTLSYIGQMPPEDKKLLSSLVNESIQCLQDFSNFLMDKTGSAYNGPFDECLLPTLELVSKKIVVDDEGEVPTEVADNSNAEGGGTVANQNVSSAPAAPPPPPPGTINSREDVKKALEKIIDYYKKNEPSSPVPFFAERTQELVDADFMEIVKNLSKESEQNFKKVLNIN